MAVKAKEREQFVNWSLQNGSIISPYITIKDSKTGGTGVFFNIDNFVKQNGAIDPESMIEVLRVPKKQSLSLDIIAKCYLEEQLEHDSKADDRWVKQGRILSKFLSNLNESFQGNSDPFVRLGLNETNILVGEIQVLTLLKKLRDILIADENISGDYKEFLTASPVSRADEYLDLLYNTDVGCIKLDDNYKYFKELFEYHDREFRHTIESERNNAVLSAFKHIIDDDDLFCRISKSITPTVLRKIEISVISRILEIPEDLKQQKDQEPSEHVHQGEYDDADDKDHISQNQEYLFAVASTMVPLIDFVNHNNDGTNAVFDVDRSTNDILLKVKGDLVKDLQGEVELFITYSEIEDVYKFVHAYGFVPWSSEKVSLYEHPIEREFLANYKVESVIDGIKYEHNYGNSLKWFGILPNIQFKLTYSKEGQLDDLHLLLDENFSPFALAKGLTYHKDRALQILKYSADDGLVDDEYFEDLLLLEEGLDNDVIQTPGVSPYSSALIEDEYLSIETIMSNLSDDEINSLLGEYVNLLSNYFKAVREPKLKEYLSKQTSYSLVTELAKFEQSLITKFLQKVESLPTDEDKIEYLMISSEDVDEDWLRYRMGPIAIPTQQRIDLLKKHSLRLESLKLDT